MLARDHYATLGVPPTADTEQIEAAYRHLSRRYHPGINPGDAHAAAVFERLEEAYRILIDPERRVRYDREGSPTDAFDTPAPDLSVRLMTDARGGSYAELFRRLREHVRRSAESQGEDLRVGVSVPLIQAERGRRVSVTVRRQEPCGHCGGRGRIELKDDRPCDRCGGDGSETFVKGALSVSCTCSDCDGDGIVTGRSCSHCHGGGRLPADVNVLVRIPPGVIDGQQVLIAGQGHCGTRGGPRGNLVAICQVEAFPGLERQGPHLRRTLPITIAEALLGAKIEVSGIDGQAATVRVPPGTQTGQQLRLREQGLELPDGRRGDMLLRVEIHVPTSLDEDSKELIRRFAARNRHDPRARTS